MFNCSPTLLGAKPGNIFTLRNIKDSKLTPLVNYWKKILNPQMDLRVIKKTEDLILIFVYRVEFLHKVIESEESKCFLLENGYSCKNLNCVFNTLTYKLKNSDFPHEIGVLLGYPIEDVKEFISQKGKNYMACGNWKVYGNLKDAQEKFNQYESCRSTLKSLVDGGISLERIVLLIKGDCYEKNCNCLLVGNRQH
nr:DUF3793 family protein [Peptoniphilus catoniae]